MKSVSVLVGTQLLLLCSRAIPIVGWSILGVSVKSRDRSASITGSRPSRQEQRSGSIAVPAATDHLPACGPTAVQRDGGDRHGVGIVAMVIGDCTVVPVLGPVAASPAFVPGLLATIFGAIGPTRANAIGGIHKGQTMRGLGAWRRHHRKYRAPRRRKDTIDRAGLERVVFGVALVAARVRRSDPRAFPRRTLPRSSC